MGPPGRGGGAHVDSFILSDLLEITVVIRFIVVNLETSSSITAHNNVGRRARAVPSMRRGTKRARA